MDFTEKEMKLGIDPLNTFSLLKALGQELDEWVGMYYQPCVADFFGINVGSNPDVESQYFFAYRWLSHSACMRLSCLADKMSWDRKKDGCTTSLIVGNYADKYANTPGDDDKECSKDNSNTEEKADETCKYKQIELMDLQIVHNNCYVCDVYPAFVMNEFCMP